MTYEIKRKCSDGAFLALSQRLLNLRKLLVCQNVFLPEPEERRNKPDYRQDRHRHTKSGLGSEGNTGRKVHRLLRFRRSLATQSEYGKSDRGNQSCKAARQLDDKCLHGKYDALVTSACLQLAVIDSICKENGRQNIQHSCGRKYKKARDEEEKYI